MIEHVVIFLYLACLAGICAAIIAGVMLWERAYSEGYNDAVNDYRREQANAARAAGEVE